MFDIMIGVQQGCVSSPLLFLLITEFISGPATMWINTPRKPRTFRSSTKLRELAGQLSFCLIEDDTLL